MAKHKEETLESILDLNASNVWNVSEVEIAQLWDKEKKEESFPPYEEKLLNIIRLAFEVVHFDNGDEREAAKYNNGEWTTFPRSDLKKGIVAIKRRTISRLNDLSYENIRHITAAKLIEVLDRNFGGGWDSLSQSIKDIIESGFDISTTTLPKDRLHKKGGLYEKKVEDGFEVLEVAKGSWVEAIFAKIKPESEKPRMKFNTYSDDEEDEDADVEIEDNYNKPDEDDVEIEDPNDDDITEDNYSTMMDLGSGDPDEEAENLSEYGDE
jgi:hypothetical protein